MHVFYGVCVHVGVRVGVDGLLIRDSGPGHDPGFRLLENFAPPPSTNTIDAPE